MAILQTHFKLPKPLVNPSTMTRSLIDLILLDQQSCFFKLTMQNHYNGAIAPPHMIVTQLCACGGGLDLVEF
jgi:hypothetical protein